MADYNIVCANCAHGPHSDKKCASCACVSFMRPDLVVSLGMTVLIDELRKASMKHEAYMMTILDLLGEAFPEARKAVEERQQKYMEALKEQEEKEREERLKQADEAYRQATQGEGSIHDFAAADGNSVEND